MKYLLIVLVWTVYCSLHSYLISIRFTTLMSQKLKRYYAFYRLFYVILSTVLLLLVFHFADQWASEVIIAYQPPWSIVRYVLIALSLMIFFKAFIFDYDALSFFGIRQLLSFGKTAITKSEEGIKKSGLLGFVRHPMYLALILFLCCQNFRLSDIVTNVVLIAYVFIGTILEERKLVLEFGDSYRKYQEEVPMLIPFIKPKR